MPGSCSRRLIGSSTSLLTTSLDAASTSATASTSASTSTLRSASLPEPAPAASLLFSRSRSPLYRHRTPWPWLHPRFHSTTTDQQPDSPSFPFPSHTPNPSPYQIFHLDSKATPAQIKSRYYDLVRLFHPDRHVSTSPHDRKKVEERFKTVVKAYELLSDQRRRMSYDRYGFGWGDERRWGTERRGWENRGDPRSSRTGGGHDRYGWQQRRSSPTDDEYFYGFAAQQSSSSTTNKPRYLPNAHFISLLFLLTWSLALIQYSRLAQQASRATSRADKLHLDAAQSLKVAREAARGKEGRRLKEAVRRRVRELGVLEQVRALERGEELLEEEEEEGSPWGVGHGGPSGKEAHLERVRRAEARGVGPVPVVPSSA
ncbi:hypothetical protein A4X13_0g2860 [Tilletia indica]|uniref:Uncharacterized protein n=1 Tax=Tilletia indica TaxID=43049 RepID=A0A177TDP8_9BASI|nr:hypothetical protein A4X13_0g2860 [Tilletia indica]